MLLHLSEFFFTAVLIQAWLLLLAIGDGQEMAMNAPTVFNVHVKEFIEAVWFALRDQKLQVRERAVEALRACLCVIENRETRWRVQW
jgi:hypothetical protein